MFRTLLSPVDGSPASEHALPMALAIAARAKATLHVALVHVPDAFGDTAAAHWADFDAEGKSHEETYLASLRRRLREVSESSIEVHHLEGIVEETLIGEVAQRNVDLVVISAHGWGYVSRAVMGSVSDYLMRHLPVPLLVVHAPPDASQNLARPVAVRRVLVPLDGSPLAESILPPARALGQLWQAEYRLLRVVAPPGSFWSWQSDAEAGKPHDRQSAAHDAATTYLDALAERLRHESLTVETSVQVAHNPAKAILDEAQAAACDLIAIATHGRGGLNRLLWGSVADKVIRGAATPVLVRSSS
ncbi:MAG: universal stress protein [Pirellulales bacterium]|nr:universal stress protein [Pirellulales bacterium]